MVTRSNEQEVAVREGMRGGKAHVTLQALTSKMPGRVKLFSTLRLIPGASIGYHRHDGETELVYILEGKGTVCDDGETYEVQAGDCTATFSGHSHGIENTGTETLVILGCIVED